MIINDLLDEPLFQYQPITHIENLDNWPEILQREMNCCGDDDYAYHLSKLLPEHTYQSFQPDQQNRIDFLGLGDLIDSFSPFNSLEGRPFTTEVELALKQACHELPHIPGTWPHLLQVIEHKQQDPGPVDKAIESLDSYEWTTRFAACYALIAMGAVAIEPLAQMSPNKFGPVPNLSRWLLKSIAFESTTRLSAKSSQLMCGNCLVRRCSLHNHDNFLKTIDVDYYACSYCGQSREFADIQCVTVLDSIQNCTVNYTNNCLRIYWPIYATPFDFDWVEIINATDEEVERFAVHVGNDTDDVRQPKYKEMTCYLSPTCQLSLNTQRILENTFGQIEVLDE